MSDNATEGAQLQAVLSHDAVSWAPYLAVKRARHDKSAIVAGTAWINNNQTAPEMESSIVSIATRLGNLFLFVALTIRGEAMFPSEHSRAYLPLVAGTTELKSRTCNQGPGAVRMNHERCRREYPLFLRRADIARPDLMLPCPVERSRQIVRRRVLTGGRTSGPWTWKFCQLLSTLWTHAWPVVGPVLPEAVLSNQGFLMSATSIRPAVVTAHGNLSHPDSPSDPRT
ncbi:hypothetical protein F5I97DRAFT_1829410 [Phlebopus sp. FC_14]|nr:hypothetical protein F5I97DRAFT_1829410 [Phlebopus sp. FC_14]